MKIIVIGAGVGGASTAIALHRLGHEVHVYDRIRENRPVGAGLSLWPNGVKVLNWLGLGDEVARMGGRMDRMAYYEGRSGEVMTQFGLAPVTLHSGQRPYPVPRAELQALLMDRVEPSRLHLGMPMTGFEDDGEKVTVHFENGESDTADLLIAADGARSAARGLLFPDAAERSYAGYTNYNGLVPVDPAIGPADQWTTYVADGKRASVMPVGDGRFYFFFDVTQPAGIPYEPAEGVAPLRAAFEGWAPGVERLIDSIEEHGVLNRVEIWDLDPIDRWASGRVALLGDAAHPTSPDIGQGACSALEDVFVLATVLATTTLGVEDALQRYERIRVARAGELVIRARKRARETHAFEPEVTQAWYDGLWAETGENIIRGLTSNLVGSPIDLGEV